MIRTGIIWTAVMIGLMIAISFAVKHGIGDAEIVPIHWNAAGEADGFASPSAALAIYWILIGIAVLMGGFFAALPMIGTLKEDLLKSQRLYLSVWLATVGLFVIVAAVIGWVTYASVSDVPSPPTTLVFAVLVRSILAVSSIGLIWLGNRLPKTRQNNVIGIRTSKTLSDKKAWEQTQRYAGKMFFIAGFVSLVIACFFPLTASALLWGVPVVVACVLSYSYSGSV